MKQSVIDDFVIYTVTKKHAKNEEEEKKRLNKIINKMRCCMTYYNNLFAFFGGLTISVGVT